MHQYKEGDRVLINYPDDGYRHGPGPHVGHVEGPGYIPDSYRVACVTTDKWGYQRRRVEHVHALFLTPLREPGT